MCILSKIKTAINQDLKVIKTPKFLNKKFILIFCNGTQKRFLEQSSGTTVKGIKIDPILQMSFPIPPLNEQSRIVSKVEELFSTLDQMERNLI